MQDQTDSTDWLTLLSSKLVEEINPNSESLSANTKAFNQTQ